MAQPISTIAEAVCEAQPKLQDDFVPSTIAAAASPIGPRGKAIKSIATRCEDGIAGNAFNDPILDAPHGGPQSAPLVPELSLIPPPTASGVADVAAPPMAPGIGGFNINPPAPRAGPVAGGVAIDDMRGRLLLKPELVRWSPIQPGRSSLVFNLLAIIALVGLTLFAFHDEAGKQVRDPPRAVMPLHEALSSARTSAHPARLVTESQKGFTNEPLPLGISLKDASGGETVTIDDLAEGTELSLGTSRGLAGWLVSAHDLDETFVGPPKDFVGVMDATVKLRSASGQLLESQVIRLEWIAKKEEGLMPALAPPEPTPVLPPLDSEQIVALIKLGDGLLGHGDIATARFLLKRAAVAGNAQAALELGLTFDQAFLALSGVQGFPPDAAQAREWYERAIKLGSAEASRHLERLASMPK
jgi:hypothetical protein